MRSSLATLLALTLLLAAPADATVILSSDFNSVDMTDGTAPYVSTNNTWDAANGIDTPAGSLTFVDPTGGDVDGFFTNVAHEISVDYNMTGDGPWSTSVALVLDAGTASIDLTTLDFNWRVTSNSGANNTPNSKSDTWTAEITGSGSGSLGTASIGPAAPGNPNQFRSIDMSSFTLDNSETWALSLRIDGTNYGHNASLKDLTLNGEITPIPEPATMGLLALGGLGLLRRRRA